MDGEEQQPPHEADVEPVVPSEASEPVPRVLSGDPQNLWSWHVPRCWAVESGRRGRQPTTARGLELVTQELTQELSLEKLQQAVRQNGLMSGLMQMLLLKVSAHITEQLGMAPGGEFREAFKEASKVPFCKFHLGDRPIPVTFKRAIAALSFWQKVRLAWGTLGDLLSDPISKDDVERCKQKDLLEQMMAEMIGEFPDLHRTIVSERDVYLTYMLRQAARRLELPRASDAEPRKCIPSVVVGVVGMGHVPGIEKNWSTDLNIQEIMTVPPPSVSGRVSRLAVKAAFFGLLGYSLYWMGRRTASLVLSLPAAQYCLQRVTEARHK
uniref:TraB domain containing n=1 Tax=Nomascus leucogenys TaxID=61853 RepID=G1QI03_NOMLE